MKKREKKHAELPLFSYESISTTTDNFSVANKLREGGFGPVYKVHFIFQTNVLCTLIRKPTLINGKASSNFKELMLLLHRGNYLEDKKL
jgi:hypothetical protein